MTLQLKNKSLNEILMLNEYLCNVNEMLNVVLSLFLMLLQMVMNMPEWVSFVLLEIRSAWWLCVFVFWGFFFSLFMVQVAWSMPSSWD